MLECYYPNSYSPQLLCTFKVNLFVSGLISHEVWNWTLCFSIRTKMLQGCSRFLPMIRTAGAYWTFSALFMGSLISSSNRWPFEAGTPRTPMPDRSPDRAWKVTKRPSPGSRPVSAALPRWLFRFWVSKGPTGSTPTSLDGGFFKGTFVVDYYESIRKFPTQKSQYMGDAIVGQSTHSELCLEAGERLLTSCRRRDRNLGRRPHQHY